MWIILKDLSRSDLTLLNIYVPNNYSERILFLDTIRESLSKSCCWISVDDYNMVEFFADIS